MDQPNPGSSHKPTNWVTGRLPSYNEIIPRLFLGDISTALNQDEITRLGITDFMTADIKPVSPGDLAGCVQRYKFINVMDHSKQDIISHFATSNEFIEEALKNPANKIYVHCVAGISRSATLVIAYIMKTRFMDYDDAFPIVHQKRGIACPNEGFVKQLKLYHRMGYTIDITNTEYRRIVFNELIFEFRLMNYSTAKVQKPYSRVNLFQNGKLYTMKKSIENIFDFFFDKLFLKEMLGHPEIYPPNTSYRCNKCRSILFYECNIIMSKPFDRPASNLFESSRLPKSSSSTSRLGFEFKAKDTNKGCPFIFIEPMAWMYPNITERDGNIQCLRCKRKLGKFDWASRESCSCLLHSLEMNFNLFKIMRKKLDFGSYGSA